MRKSLNQISKNLELIEFKGKIKDPEEFLIKIISNYGLKKFTVDIEPEFNCYGRIYHYAVIETTRSRLKFRFLAYADRYNYTENNETYELPKEFI